MHLRFVAALAFFLSAATCAAAYPERPVRLIDPYAPGGGSGVVARLLGAKLGEAWGKQIVVDNRPGAAAAIGTEICARAVPDGYTLCMGTSGSIAISPNMNKVPYDPVKDLIAITQTSAQSMLVVLHPSVPINSVKELIAYARANPNKLIYASSGTGGSGHLAAELFLALTKTTHDARAVQGKRTRLAGAGERRSPARLQQHAGGAAARQQRQAEGDRGDQRPTRARRA